jgi:hypothetical protein
MEGSYPNVSDGGISQGLKTFRYSRGYIEIPSSAPLVPKILKSRLEFEPSTSADHQISRSFFGPMDSQPQSLRSTYSSQEEAVRTDSFPDSGINVQTPNSESSSQKRYPSPLSARSIQPTTPTPGEVPTRPPHSHSPLRNEVLTAPLIPHRPAPLPPNPTPKPKPFKRILAFFSNLDDKYEAYLARRQNKKKFEALVKGKEREDEEERGKVEEGMRGQIEAHRERERVRNEEMERTRREVERARKRQTEMKRDLICRKRKLEREKRKEKLGDGKSGEGMRGWRSKLQSKFRNLSLSTLSFPWNKKKREQKEQLEQREIDFKRRWQRAEARRTMREREQGGILGRQVFEPNPFEDMNAARRESKFRETIREVGSESESETDEYYDGDEDYNSSEGERIAGQVRAEPFSYCHYRHTVA